MQSETRTYRTGSEEVVLDLTQDAVEFVADRGDGLLQVFVPHATAGIAVIETGAGSDDDLLAALEDLLPADDRWRHRHGSPGRPCRLHPEALPRVLERRNAVGFPLLPGDAGVGTGRGQDSAGRRRRVRGPDPQGEWTNGALPKRPASIGLGRRDSMAG